jgi:hypothetical protein
MVLFRYLFGDWRKAFVATVAMQVGKEVYDFIFNKCDFDPLDWLGDGLAYLPFLVVKYFKAMKKSILIITMFFSVQLLSAKTYYHLFEPLSLTERIVYK